MDASEDNADDEEDRRPQQRAKVQTSPDGASVNSSDTLRIPLTGSPEDSEA